VGHNVDSETSSKDKQHLDNLQALYRGFNKEIGLRTGTPLYSHRASTAKDTLPDKNKVDLFTKGMAGKN
jgi:hypothetical protein